MDFAGDRQLANGAVFHPDSCLTPFPEPRYPIFHDPTAEIRPPQPQKLRPIRSQGRNADDNSDHETAGRRGDDGEIRCYGSELGFLTQSATQKASGLNEVRCESSSQVFNGRYALPDVGDDVSRVVKEMKSEMDAQIIDLINQGRAIEDEFSSSSDEGSESSEAVKGPTNRKRKRKTTKSLKLIMKNIVRKILFNQEQMYMKLLEIMEKNEKERLIREEAWKQQETERARRDEELRLVETSRNLALIFYIQDFFSHEISMPKPSFEDPCPEKDEEEITSHDSCNSDPSNRKWSKAEVQSLITIRTALDHKFVNGHIGTSWEMLAAGMSKMGYNRSATKCKEKWETINKYYMKTLENGKRHENSAPCPYFQELDYIYKSGLITSVDATTNI